MAIYHFHAKVIKRSEGRNSVQCAAYRHAARFYDEAEDVFFDFTKKKDVIFGELLVPQNAPAWAKEFSTLKSELNSSSLSPTHSTSLKFLSNEIKSYDLSEVHVASEKLWNLIEKTEQRMDSQLAREIEFSLPIELNAEQNIHLARSFLNDQLVTRGMMVDWSVHWDNSNPHVHALITMRSLEDHGFGNKERDWNRKELLLELRAKWADYANFYLHYCGHDVRIDHRSFVDQGIDLVPTFHRGKAVRDMERRGIRTERTEEAFQINNTNLSRIAEKPSRLLEKVMKQHSHFGEEELVQSLQTYANENSSYAQSPTALSSVETFAKGMTAENG